MQHQVNCARGLPDSDYEPWMCNTSYSRIWISRYFCAWCDLVLHTEDPVQIAATNHSLRVTAGVEGGETAVKLARRWGQVKKKIP
jgi:hypothetical protein